MEYSVGKAISSWGDDKTQTITFVVTEECNLRCKYCYITHKSSNKRMNLDIAKKCVDFMLEGKFERSDAVILEFIGGEPFLEIELIDNICDYFKIRAFQLKTDWYWNYRISICTNGVNFLDDKVQRFLNKNEGKVSCNITIDGTKEKHDLNRVFASGEGSFDYIKEGLDNYIKRGFSSTKVTFSSDDIKYLADSIAYLWKIGIKEVAANVVFEDVWKNGDDVLFEKQLKKLADYIVDNNLYSGYKCSFFDDTIGYEYTEQNKSETFCGAGKMMAFDCNGDIYPCIRYKGYSLNRQSPRMMGNVFSGIDMEKVRPFELAAVRFQSSEECLNCPVATGCGFCQGFNYDDSGVGTNFYRAKYICAMHKARVRANNYYFARLFNRYGIKRKSSRDARYMYFILDDKFADYCCEHNTLSDGNSMPISVLEKGLELCEKYFYQPIFVHSDAEREETIREKDFLITNILYYSKKAEKAVSGVRVYSFDENNYRECEDDKFESAILIVDADRIFLLSEMVKTIWNCCERVDMYIQNLTADFDFKEYDRQLEILVQEIVRYKKEKGIIKEINALTDAFTESGAGCGAGDHSVTYAPDGNIYPCVAFYIRGDKEYILQENDLLDCSGKRRWFVREKNPLCSVCQASNCVNCVVTNRESTGEICVSPSFQCKKGILEYNRAHDLLDTVGCDKRYEECMDPFKTAMGERRTGIYMGVN